MRYDVITDVLLNWSKNGDSLEKKKLSVKRKRFE